MHVHHDERAARHRWPHRGHVRRRRLRGRAALRARPAPGPPAGVQGPYEPDGAHRPALRRQAHAPPGARLCRGQHGAVRLRRDARRRAADRGHVDARGRGRAPRGRTLLGIDDPHDQVVAQRVRLGGEQARDPGPRWLRLHQGLHRRAALPRRPRQLDLRGHDGHPVHRPFGPQGAHGQGRGDARFGEAHHGRYRRGQVQAGARLGR
mmetsp:Transcript_27754/g.93269  ORF Transcript_27754/g.93269 Transcript_27754/m.93269 type:complete len:207 (+) Transcript_27754:993-1613(+)